MEKYLEAELYGRREFAEAEPRLNSSFGGVTSKAFVDEQPWEETP